MKVARVLVYALMAVVGLALLAAQLGALTGNQPADLGVKDGHLKPTPLKRNGVSSQADLYPDHPQRVHALIQPMPPKHGDTTASLRVLAKVLQTQPGVRLTEQRPDYLYAQTHTRWFKFVDDLEFWFNPVRGEIEVRSASRLGPEDAGLNLRRMQNIRAAHLRQ